MSEGCWLFTLKMAAQSLETSLSGDFSQMWLLVKSTNLQYLGLVAKTEKSKTTLFSQTFEVAENKKTLFF